MRNNWSECHITWPSLTLLLQHIHYQFKKEEIEFPIIHRINSVFKRATNKWKVMYTLILHFWCVIMKSMHSSITRTYQYALSFDWQFIVSITEWIVFSPQGDVQLWLSHAAFCKKWVCNDLLIWFKSNSDQTQCLLMVTMIFNLLFLQATKGQISKVFSAMLAIHPDKPGKEDNAFQTVWTKWLWTVF